MDKNRLIKIENEIEKIIKNKNGSAFNFQNEE